MEAIMANLKSSKKDIRRIKRRREQNIPKKTRLRNLGKKIYNLVAQGEFEEASSQLQIYYKLLDRASRISLLPERRVARYKSRAAKLIEKHKKIS